jgi:hypothetical protein
MRTFLIAAIAVAVSGAAFAKDLKRSVMTDSEMDKVTAGAAFVTGNPNGNASNRSLKVLHGQHINYIEHNFVFSPRSMQRNKRV